MKSAVYKPNLEKPMMRKIILSFLMVFLDKKCYPYCSPLTYFLIQLGLNLIWTTVFFKWRMILPALILLFLILLFTYYKLT